LSFPGWLWRLHANWCPGWKGHMMSLPDHERMKLADPNAFWDAVYEAPEFRAEIKQRVLADCASGDPERKYWADVPITRKGEETSFITA
jgi:hypothetical protein